MSAATPSAIRRGRKFDQVLAGARTIFLRDGFERASVDEIAREAGVSKATLYSYFPDKRLLFLEMALIECRRHADESTSPVDYAAPTQNVLRQLARQVLAVTCSDIGLRVYRICISEGERFPELARAFYRAGPLAMRASLVDYLHLAASRGDLRIVDYEFAADQFVQLCRAGLHERLLFNGENKIPTAVQSRVVEGAIQMFLATYGGGADMASPSAPDSAPGTAAEPKP
jgi:TetR/AcrR family transcriptional repressor of mexJK operon